MKEIFRLKEMLENENIPFEFIEHEDVEGYQITYPIMDTSILQFDISIIQHKYSYGNDENLLEMWDLSKGEPEGYLSAEEVLERIKHKAGGIDERNRNKWMYINTKRFNPR